MAGQWFGGSWMVWRALCLLLILNLNEVTTNSETKHVLTSVTIYFYLIIIKTL